MRSILLLLEYDGTAYCGWQIQPQGPTVQAEVENALRRLTGEDHHVIAASRTDAGVHARGQVVVFRTESPIPPEKFCLALNSRLPEDIVARASFEVPETFHPRRDAIRKCYRYQIHTGPIRPVLDRHRVWHIHHPLHLSAMEEAAMRFVGTKDFTSFSNQECNRPDADNIRTIERCTLISQGERLTIEIVGKSFLYNMVRAIVGTLVDVGRGRFQPEAIETMFLAKNRRAAGQGAPPHGLCLEWIEYPPPIPIVGERSNREDRDDW